MFFITILMFICFYSSAGSIQTFPGDRSGRGQGSSVSFSKEDQKKSHAALISLPSLSLLFCSLSFFPAFPTPRATPATPPPPGCVHCCVCAPDGLIVALFGFVSPPRAPSALRFAHFPRSGLDPGRHFRGMGPWSGYIAISRKTQSE